MGIWKISFVTQLQAAAYKDAEGKQVLEDFKREVIERSVEPPWNDNYAARNNILVCKYELACMYFSNFWLLSFVQSHFI